MTTGDPQVPMGEVPSEASELADAAVQHLWPSKVSLSSISSSISSGLGSGIGSGIVGRANAFLTDAGFDKGPWLTVSFACGIATWFVLDAPWQWLAVICCSALTFLAAQSFWRERDDRTAVRQAVCGLALMFAIGTATIWVRSEIVGAEATERPNVSTFNARILEREEQPALDRVRLVLAMRDAESGQARKVRINVPAEKDLEGLTEGAAIRLRARLMPPAPPMLPGAYNFARAAWFKGYAATGSSLGDIEIVERAVQSDRLATTQRRLSGHVRGQLGGSAGAIAAALASGDRGGISDADEEAMRDAGLTHLLSISGLHVSAVIAAAYLLMLKSLALWPWLALRVRLPLAAAAIAALAGVGYTLLTGAEVPTVRSCVGAVLVLIALSLGREALSLRMIAVAAAFVLFLWPESLVGPSFQMSFAAVLTIIALHNSAPVQAFLAPREESWLARSSRRVFMLLATGFVIEIALMPIVLFHFHRAGVYGAFANVIGIPLTTFLSMPLIGLSLFLDLFGLGAPAWWLTGKSLDLLIGIAHFTADQPGSVKLMPDMGAGLFAMFLAGGLWLAMWKGKVRLYGLALSLVAAALFALKPAPDLLISGDGRHVGIAGEGDRLIVLRESRSSYARDNLLQMAGMGGMPVPLDTWSGADCSRDFCVITLKRGGKDWHVMMARSSNRVDARALAAACDRADIVVADRYLPRSCQPKWLKADRNLLGKTGGLSINLTDAEFESVADSMGQHGWWRGER